MAARRRTTANPLEKKIPENPKYKHVRATVDTGASVSKYTEKMEELKRNYNFRPDEIFKRMKIPTFVQLVVQVAELDASTEEIPEQPTSRYRPDTADREVARIQMGNGETAENTARDSSSTDTGRSRLEQVINGVGEIDLDASSQVRKTLSMLGSACPYLLLDVREMDAFEECHIISGNSAWIFLLSSPAKSYPTAMLARSVNYETKDMLSYKNQPGKIILVYDDDERISHRASTTLVQRGYNNLFMLSGGLKVAYKLFPMGLITGTIPTFIYDEAHQGHKGSKNRELPPKTLANVEQFTPELIEQLSAQLDSSLSDKSASSRLSKSSKSSRTSSISSCSVNTSIRKPFK